MKMMYKGFIYEEDYHRGPTSHFNLDFISKIHDLAVKIGMFAFKLVRSPNYQPDQIFKVVSSPNIYIQISNKTAYAESDAELSDYSDGYLITIPEKYATAKDIGNDVFVNIMHEVTHILQRENGQYSDLAHNHLNGLNLNAYFNDPTEVNAFIMSIIGFITFSPSRARLMTKMPFDVFVNHALSFIGGNKKNFIDYMANGHKSEHPSDGGDNTYDSTRSKFYEIMHLLYNKLKQGYFLSLQSMRGV